ncbi:hypothetical protein GCM10025857_00510 [Alicyclobacillus contaminans]|uniref:prephenate dehydrogenase n=1 Tax=Alicyclobacillus contaminans TaxID=392016 RepID=UPI0003F6DACA|nr:prephenate dehydrogenase [Alicyclobacillus contaminans]GMA48694.1 hypothetical protein GCM10025857_00510 [Alicyclobacillus contaminans]
MSDWKPQSILIVGCGLLGASFAKAVHAHFPQCRLHAVEVDAAYRAWAEASGLFETVVSSLPERPVFDLAVLATPVDVACRQLPKAASVARWVMDVCSVKQQICQAAVDSGVQGQFAPTHPMAGLAVPGPSASRGDLFEQRTWLILDGWPACAVLAPFLAGLGAKVETVPSAEVHDAAMASVSHGIHVTSLCALLAADREKQRMGGEWQHWVGPAFRDITRLAASPSGFWTSTLLANRDAVQGYLEQLQTALHEVSDLLRAGDPGPMKAWLEGARDVHTAWGAGGPR